MLLSFRKKPGGYLDAVIVVVGWGTSIYSATSIFAFDVPSVDISLPSFSPFLSLSLSLSLYLAFSLIVSTPETLSEPRLKFIQSA